MLETFVSTEEKKYKQMERNLEKIFYIEDEDMKEELNRFFIKCYLENKSITIKEIINRYFDYKVTKVIRGI